MTWDIEGLGRARMDIAALAKSPVNSPRSELRHKLVDALYTEIRAARIAGHSWQKIKDAITANVNIRISAQALRDFFAELDHAYAKETGTTAIEPLKSKGKKRTKKNLPAKD